VVNLCLPHFRTPQIPVLQYQRVTLPISSVFKQCLVTCVWSKHYTEKAAEANIEASVGSVVDSYVNALAET
jgi:hypothetical protein